MNLDNIIHNEFSEMVNLEFIQAPFDAMLALKPNQFMVFAYLYTMCKMNRNSWERSYSYIEDDLNMGKNTAPRIIKQLMDLGYITYEQGNIRKEANVYHIVSMSNSANSTDNTMSKTANTSMSNSANSTMSKTAKQKEYIKEKRKYIDNIVYMEYNNSTCSNKENKKESGKLIQEVEIRNKQNNNNMIIDNNEVELMENSQSAVQSEDWTKQQMETTHSSIAVVQYGDSPKYIVQTEDDNSSILATIPSATPSKAKKPIQQLIPQTHENDTLSSISSKNAAGGDKNPTVDNYTTPTEKTQQDAPEDAYMSIDDLEMIHNGGHTIPNSSKPNAAHLNDSFYEGGGRKFTNRKEWEVAMRVALNHIGDSSDLKNRLSGEDLKIITEGTTDKYRVIDTLKAIQQMLTYRVKFSAYDVWLNNSIDTIENNEKEYSEKQYDYACEIYDDCVDRYQAIINDKKY